MHLKSRNMKQTRDILDNQDLRNHPFSVPEGYFESMPERMKSATLVKGHAQRRLATYMALAASFLILIAGGTFFLRNTDDATPIELYSNHAYTADDMTEDDIIEYLLWSGANVEEFGEYLDE